MKAVLETLTVVAMALAGALAAEGVDTLAGHEAAFAVAAADAFLIFSYSQTRDG